MNNRHGLSRDIPAPVQRLVRQRCGFGCVLCGSAIYQYEHLSPPFHEATEHDPAGIVLLCGGCHDRKSRGLLSTETVLVAAASPKALSQGFSFGPFDLGGRHPDVVLGTFRACRCFCIVRAFGESLLSVAPPEEPGAPFRLSALLCDSAGREVLRIVDNEWRTSTANWDVEVTGQRILIRQASRDVTLQLRSEPPDTLVIERLAMYFRGARIECESDGVFRATTPAGQVFEATAATATECRAALVLSAEGLAVGEGCKGGLSLPHGRLYVGPRPSAAPSLPRVGRNEPCPCGSHVKYKKCHGKRV